MGAAPKVGPGADPAWAGVAARDALLGAALPAALAQGRYRARWAESGEDLIGAQRLRGAAFGSGALDADRFDATCHHLMVETAGGGLVAALRVALVAGPADLGLSYAAQFYHLTALVTARVPVLEIGRFCRAPDGGDPDVLRLTWAAIARMVDRTGARLLCGCTSLAGTDPQTRRAGLALLARSHLAPPAWQTPPRSAAAFGYAAAFAGDRPERALAMRQLPPLLRSYLALGGCVSDHLVIDRALGTMHVFTAVPTEAVPLTRAARLRAIAGQSDLGQSDLGQSGAAPA